MKILVFYVDKQYFNMVILFLRLRVRRELIIRRDGRAVEGTGLENRRCESIRGFESHSLRQLNFSIDLRKYPRGRRGSPAKGVGRVKSAAEVQILSSAPSKNLEAITVSPHRYTMCHGGTAGTGKSKTQAHAFEFASCFFT